jgi:hypothetical protein
MFQLETYETVKDAFRSMVLAMAEVIARSPLQQIIHLQVYSGVSLSFAGRLLSARALRTSALCGAVRS